MAEATEKFRTLPLGTNLADCCSLRDSSNCYSNPDNLLQGNLQMRRRRPLRIGRALDASTDK